MELPEKIGGRYAVRSLLGQGGMGRVLLAEDEVLGREVAIKILREDVVLERDVKAALLARMRQEARAAASLSSHPNIVTLHDMGEDEEAGLFLVFERIIGKTLRERLGEGPLPLDEVETLARELGSALTHAHEARVIHRDIKPENVMLSRTGSRITDFGIARVEGSKLTKTGTVLGTPAYSAPEALALAEFSPASDQFSLGVLLYEAISGGRPFTGDDALEIATKVATERHAPIGMERIDLVLDRALSKDTDKRWPSCAALGEALAAAIAFDREAAAAAPPEPAPTSKREDAPPPKRWQNFVTAAIVIAIIGALLLSRRNKEVSGVSFRAASNAFRNAIGLPATSGAQGPAPVPRASVTHP